MVSVGPGALEDGNIVQPEVKVGDRVFYSKYTGTQIKIGEEELTVMTQMDIFGVIEDE